MNDFEVLPDRWVGGAPVWLCKTCEDRFYSEQQYIDHGEKHSQSRGVAMAKLAKAEEKRNEKMKADLVDLLEDLSPRNPTG